MKAKSTSATAAGLRRLAEQRLQERQTKKGAPQTEQDTLRLLHELQVHQIELEMQNEELRQARQELEASRDWYFDLCDQMPVGYFRLSEKGVILETNAAAAALLGASRAALIKQPLTSYVLPEDRDIYYRHRQQLLETGKPQACELRMVHRDGGTPFWARVEAVVARDAETGAPVWRATMSDITDRKQAEESLERERRQLLLIFDNIDEPVYVADPNTYELLYVNEAFRRQWGEGVGGKCHETLQGLDGPCSFCTNDRIFGANIGQPYVWEFQNRMNGLWYRCKDKAIGWPDGRIVRYEMAVDITERKRAEQALKDSEERFRTLAENVPGVVYLCRDDPRHTMIYVSESVQELTGVSAAEFVSGGVSFADLYHPDDAAGIGPGMDAAVAEKRQFVLVYRLKHADGRWRWIEERGCGVFAQDGELRFLEGALTDITERKQAEKALRRERDFADGVIETAQCIVLVLDLEGRILRFNPYLEEICGCSSDVVQGSDWYAKFVPEAERDRARQAFRQALDDIRTPGLVSPIRTQDGREREIEWNSRAIKDESGRTVGLLAVGQDITERKRAAEAALQRHAELAHVHRLSTMGELATGLAHELNQPLCAVSTCVQTCLRLMKARPEGLSEVTEGLQEAVAQVERASEIIRRLRNFVRKHEPKRLPVVLSEVIKDTVAGVQAEARRCGIAIKLELAEEMPSVPVDSVQIQQVLLNLVRNSIEAIKGAHVGPGEIRIEARPADGQVEVVVRDTGPGLPAKALEKVFESFYTTKPHGLGLGLPLSRSFIEAHGGRLWATPNSDGGVAFRFTLPLSTGANTDGSRTDRIRRG